MSREGSGAAPQGAFGKGFDWGLSRAEVTL